VQRGWELFDRPLRKKIRGQGQGAILQYGTGKGGGSWKGGGEGGNGYTPLLRKLSIY